MGTDYYPFGLTMSGISSKALNFGDPRNKEKTFQGQRFDDDLGVNYIQFKYRSHDPQIGRFIQIDPLAAEYEYNSTYAFSENRVTSSVEIEGLEAKDLYNELGPVREHRAKHGMPEDPKEIKIAKAVIGGLILLVTPGPDELILLGIATKAARTAKTADAVVDTKKAIDKAEDVADVKKVPNPNGKKGGPEHQKKMDEVEEQLKKDGYDKVDREVKVETPGGTKETRYVDVQGTNTTTGTTKQVQVGKQNKNGTPVSREKKALDDVEKSTGQRPNFVPYNKQ